MCLQFARADWSIFVVVTATRSSRPASHKRAMVSASSVVAQDEAPDAPAIKARRWLSISAAPEPIEAVVNGLEACASAEPDPLNEHESSAAPITIEIQGALLVRAIRGSECLTISIRTLSFAAASRRDHRCSG